MRCIFIHVVGGGKFFYKKDVKKLAKNEYRYGKIVIFASAFKEARKGF